MARSTRTRSAGERASVAVCPGGDWLLTPKALMVGARGLPGCRLVDYDRRFPSGCPLGSQRGFISKFFRFVITGLWFLVRLLAMIWATLAIYYSNLPWAELRLGLAA